MPDANAKPKRNQQPQLVVLLAVMAGLGLTAWWAGASVVPDLFPTRFAVVDEGSLYRSGKLTPAALKKVITERDIRTVIDLGAWEEGSKDDRLAQATCESLGVTRYRFNLYGDTRGNPNAYVQALRLIEEKSNLPMLIHCGAGTERTGCLVVFHRHFHQGVPVEEAYAEARERGHSPTRNIYFQPTLEKFTDAVGEALRTGGQIPEQAPLPEPVPVRLADLEAPKAD